MLSSAARAFKHQSVRGDGQPLTSGESAQRLREAVNILEGEANIKCNTASPLCVVIQQGNTLELRGFCEGVFSEGGDRSHKGRD